jgi:hypothetical protein
MISGRAAALCRRQDDLGPPDVLLRAVSIRHDPFQPVSVRSAHLDADPFAHAAACHGFFLKGILRLHQTTSPDFSQGGGASGL